MSTERGHALRWTCPECRTTVRTEALDLERAEGALLDVVREHLASFHGAEDVNAHAAASWLAPAGHLVTLWGGPYDGLELWCPPGDLPDVIGVTRAADGAVVPIRSAAARLLPHVVSYRLGELAGARARGARPRYLYDGRPR